MKFRRHTALLEIIEKEMIETQEELCERLRSMGYDVTQATVSRDIKDLRLIKVTDQQGRSRYCAASGGNSGEFNARLRVIFRESVVSVDSANNMVVIKTLQGVANAAAAAIDGMHFPDLVGSLAGDDTIFLVLRSEEKALEFREMVRKLLGS